MPSIYESWLSDLVEASSKRNSKVKTIMAGTPSAHLVVNARRQSLLATKSAPLTPKLETSGSGSSLNVKRSSFISSIPGAGTLFKL
jgi:hypothetical protein